MLFLTFSYPCFSLACLTLLSCYIVFSNNMCYYMNITYIQESFRMNLKDMIFSFHLYPCIPSSSNRKVKVTSLSSNTCKACIKWLMQKNTLTIAMKCCIKYLHVTRHDATRRDMGHHYTRSRAEMPLCYLKFLGRTLNTF